MYVNGKSLIALGIVFPVLGTLAVTARFLARRKCRTRLMIDDWLCVPALVTVVAIGALLIWGSVDHVFRYYSTPASSPELFIKLFYAICMLNTAGAGCIRLSFVFFYRRVFRGRVFNIVSWITIVVVSAWTLAFIVAKFTFCGDDLSAFWSHIYHHGSGEKCASVSSVVGAEGVSCFILDIVILSMPCFWIWRLNIQTSQKWAISSVFLAGIFTVCTSAIRMVARLGVLRYNPDVRQSMLGFTTFDDNKAWLSLVLFWEYVEHGTAMVVCCMPSIKPLLSNGRVFKIFESIRSLAFRSVSDMDMKSRGSTLTDWSRVDEETGASANKDGVTVVADTPERELPV